MKGPAVPKLPWLEAGDPLPDPENAWGPDAPAPGLLAAGGALDKATLRDAYAHGIFPWFSEGQPILWWSPDPRMVLRPAEFRLHRSFRKTLQRFLITPGADLRIDTAFDQVIRHCAHTPRHGQDGTWILPEMQSAYGALHRAGHAHSVEVWDGGDLVGGLYCVAIGQAVFGESMFAHRNDASKIALAGLVAFCRHHGVGMVDCQQNTRHLASLGAGEITRRAFLDTVAQARHRPALAWSFEPLYWHSILPTR
ncbi:leucyl/phenylalanyl-tRNA--protein transferase [Xylophilus ampelinus]|uniref:Leucyl/phenylalanyl-tRNA--protein transferase n=1 Tax=Xylophilus ampelinus TaxID=54067 RepID=A0A318SPH1_9BURK|nr:leucyl/phenylalanyl-tRNA--protein transferase [Xylophilus ampelinus]MCS4508742.1 leucyl/phenylalanyl-tRNA--protein transferase [Xylophilus ampelinus]PYE79312.1 leucyl/phenylalanyl-tRNA--protein transferase [Xylophilus ampelinus]